jgi:hypothetical protein
VDRRFELLEPLGQEVPADGDAEQDQEESPEEPGVIRAEGVQRKAPFFWSADRRRKGSGVDRDAGARRFFIA